MLRDLDIAMLIVYALVCIGIGIYGSKKQKAVEYLIAGRKLGKWGFTFSVLASYIGGSALVAYSAFVYEFGISAISLFIGTSVGFLLFIRYAKQIRLLGKEKEFITLSDWFYHHFGTRAGLLSAIIMLFVYFGLLMNQFIAGSSILSSISGWSYESSLFLSGTVILIYLILGGFRSVIKTDIFQYLVLIVLFAVLVFVMMTEKRTAAIDLFKPGKIDISMTIGFIAYGILSVFYASEYWQRIYAAKNDSVIRKGFINSAIWIVLTGFVLSMIGLFAKINIPGLEAKEALAYGLSQILPQSLLGLGLILIFAAIMSSADTMIFVLASSLAKDFFAHFIHKDPDQEYVYRLTKIFILIISVSSIVAAYFFRDIVAIVMTIAGVGFAIVPPVIASFHWKIKPVAAFAALLSGSVYVIVLILTNTLISELAVASVLVSAIVLFVFQKIKRI
ncbi:MAG: sodium:solute symporter family protein [Bacteroidota bacterium]|nr:sodium:solute symporter family protein [Bacteroidota bacterium]